MTERLERWIYNPEAPSSSSASRAFFPGAPIKIDKQTISYW